MIHSPPRNVMIAHCAACGRVAFARHVNRADAIPVRYCRLCGAELECFAYTCVEDDLTAGGNPIRSHPEP